MGASPNDGINVAAGTTRSAVAVAMACHWITTQSSERERIKWRFSKALVIAKTCFQCEKAVATVKEWKKVIPAEWAADVADLGRRWSIFTREYVNTNVYQELLRQHVFPWGPEDVSWWKIHLSIDLVHTTKTPSGSLQNSGLGWIGRHIHRTWTH